MANPNGLNKALTTLLTDCDKLKAAMDKLDEERAKLQAERDGKVLAFLKAHGESKTDKYGRPAYSFGKSGRVKFESGEIVEVLWAYQGKEKDAAANGYARRVSADLPTV